MFDVIGDVWCCWWCDIVGDVRCCWWCVMLVMCDVVDEWCCWWRVVFEVVGDVWCYRWCLMLLVMFDVVDAVWCCWWCVMLLLMLLMLFGIAGDIWSSAEGRWPSLMVAGRWQMVDRSFRWLRYGFWWCSMNARWSLVLLSCCWCYVMVGVWLLLLLDGVGESVWWLLMVIYGWQMAKCSVWWLTDGFWWMSDGWVVDCWELLAMLGGWQTVICASDGW